MFNKLKAVFQAIAAVVLICLVIAIAIVALPILFAIATALVIGAIGVIVYQANKEG